jgi:hypothetical protein
MRLFLGCPHDNVDMRTETASSSPASSSKPATAIRAASASAP